MSALTASAAEWFWFQAGKAGVSYPAGAVWGSDCSLLPSTTQLKTVVKLWLDSVTSELSSNLNDPTVLKADGILNKLCRLIRKLVIPFPSSDPWNMDIYGAKNLIHRDLVFLGGLFSPWEP